MRLIKTFSDTYPSLFIYFMYSNRFPSRELYTLRNYPFQTQKTNRDYHFFRDNEHLYIASTVVFDNTYTLRNNLLADTVTLEKTREIKIGNYSFSASLSVEGRTDYIRFIYNTEQTAIKVIGAFRHDTSITFEK